MQKIKATRLVFCSVLLLFFYVYTQSEMGTSCCPPCTDSDGKDNFDVSGWCNGSNGYFEDKCNGDYAVDYYCQSGCGNCAPTYRYCEYGCSDGVCNLQPTTTSTTTVRHVAKKRTWGDRGGLPPNIAKPKKTCFDGIKNCHDGSCEEGIDCGGPCKPCLSCFDGIQNQGEEGIDCGGPCKPCPTTPITTTTTSTTTTTIVQYPTCSDGIQNQGEEGIDCGGPCPPCKIEQPDIVGNVLKYTGRGSLLIFPILLLILGIYYREKRRDREAEKKYGYIIDSILKERGLTDST